MLEPGAPATLAAEGHVLASGDVLGATSGSLARVLLPDGGDVYWYDYEASVFVERQGNGQVTELRHGEPPSETHFVQALGLAANEDRLFVGYAQRSNFAIDFLSLEYDPPGRLLSISKQDGQSELLLELDDYWMAPIAADAARVIVFAIGDNGSGSFDIGFYQVLLAAPRLEPLPLSRSIAPGADSSEVWEGLDPFTGGQLVGDEMYWVTTDYPRRLLRARFDDTEPQEWLQAPDASPYWVGPGYLMTQANAWLPDSRYAGKDLVVRDDAGCRGVRGPRASGMRGTALDAQFAYWASYDGGLEPSGNDVRLTRVDLESGTLTYLTTHGLSPSSSLEIVGHDDTRIFLSGTDGLVSVQKP